jgi:hypothetical protein
MQQRDCGVSWRYQAWVLKKGGRVEVLRLRVRHSGEFSCEKVITKPSRRAVVSALGLGSGPTFDILRSRRQEELLTHELHSAGPQLALSIG